MKGLAVFKKVHLQSQYLNIIYSLQKKLQVVTKVCTIQAQSPTVPPLPLPGRLPLPGWLPIPSSPVGRLPLLGQLLIFSLPAGSLIPPPCPYKVNQHDHLVLVEQLLQHPCRGGPAPSSCCSRAPPPCPFRGGPAPPYCSSCQPPCLSCSIYMQK